MANTYHLVEKKMKFLGSWDKDEVNKDVMGRILQLIQSKKGSIVKLELRRDGLRVLKSRIISGLVLQYFIPLNNICIITYNHKAPRILFVVSKENHIYQISTFKCENTIDAREFFVGFRNIRKNVYSVTHKKHDGINGTFDSLGKDAQPGLAIKHAEAKMKMIEFNTSTRSTLNCTKCYDRASELSENAPRSGDEYMPKNAGGIKVIHKNFTGSNPDYTRKYNNEDAFDAIMVLDEEEEIDTNSKTVSQPRTENKTKLVQNGHTKDGLVRISVPNYRNNRKKLSTAGGHVLILPTIFEEVF